MRRLLSIALFLTSVSPALAAGPSWPLADIPRFYILGEGNTHFSVDGSYFLTKENFDGDGQVASPAALEHVRYGNARFHVGHGFTPRVSIFAQADIRGLFELNAQRTNISDDENYGLGDAMVAFRYLAYRSQHTDKVYPTEWSPATWLALVEGSWVFPMYDRADTGKPPLGDQSNDFTMMGRLVWYANEWFGLAGNAGYTHRTSAYTATVPWGIRVDLNFLRAQKIRFWIDFQNQEQISRGETILNSSQVDSFPSGSLLFKSASPITRHVTLGGAYRLGKEWELAGGALVTSAGVNTAKGYGGTLGLAWRPYQMPEITYDEYRKQQIKKLQEEPRQFRQRQVVSYGIQATVLKVSGAGNFFQIGIGQQGGLKPGDLFLVFAPDDLSGNERRPLAIAKLQVSRTSDSFLRVEQKYDRNFQARPGHEVRRVIFAE